MNLRALFAEYAQTLGCDHEELIEELTERETWNLSASNFLQWLEKRAAPVKESLSVEPHAECKAAFAAGQKIEFRAGPVWLSAATPTWKPEVEYRISPTQ